MRGFDDRFIDELKQKNDIVDVVSRYVSLTKKGGNFWGVCPFHHEKTPSFAVNPAGQFFNCFGCHKSGDVITFVSEIEALDFADTVKLLAERVKMPLPEIKYDDQKIKEQKRQKERALELLRDTAMFYARNLRTEKADKHVEYILKRKIDPETVTRFGLGASLNFNDLVKYLLDKGYTYEEMTASGVVDSKNGRYYDALGGRLIIPIINAFNQVIAFGGRLLEKADFAKYKNTCETSVFSKKNTLYNINNLKKLKNEQGLDGVIIVEGYMDTISLASAGFNNVVASMGTSLTKDQARILKRYSDKVYISYDGDFAGQKASIRGLEILSQEGLEVKVVSMPDGMDPDDVIKQMGAEGYRKLLLEAMPLIDFKLDIVKRTFDVNAVDGKRKYIVNAIKVIRESASPSEQEDLLKTVREVSGVNLETLKRELYAEPSKPIEQNIVVPNNEGSEELGDKTLNASRFILYSFLFNKDYAQDIDITQIEFILPVHIEIARYIRDRKLKGAKILFGNLYEELEDSNREELTKIGEWETSKAYDYNQATYFNDSVKTMKLYSINKALNELTQRYSKETDTEKRKEIALLMQQLLTKKNKLN